MTTLPPGSLTVGRAGLELIGGVERSPAAAGRFAERGWARARSA
ncbi:MAG: hypothetical protein ABR529_08645 [Actinomycetota bacterium]